MANNGVAQFDRVFDSHDPIIQILEQILGALKKDEGTETDDGTDDTVETGRAHSGVDKSEIDISQKSIGQIVDGVGAGFIRAMDGHGTGQLNEIVQNNTDTVAGVAPHPVPVQTETPLSPKPSTQPTGAEGDTMASSQEIGEEYDPTLVELTDESMVDLAGEIADQIKEDKEADLNSAAKDKNAVAAGSPGGGGLLTGLLGMAGIFAAVVGKSLLDLAGKGLDMIKDGIGWAGDQIGGAWDALKDGWNWLWGDDEPEKPPVKEKAAAKPEQPEAVAQAKLPWDKQFEQMDIQQAASAPKRAQDIPVAAVGKAELKKIPGVGFAAGGLGGSERAMKDPFFDLPDDEDTKTAGAETPEDTSLDELTVVSDTIQVQAKEDGEPLAKTQDKPKVRKSKVAKMIAPATAVAMLASPGAAPTETSEPPVVAKPIVTPGAVDEDIVRGSAPEEIVQSSQKQTLASTSDKSEDTKDGAAGSTSTSTTTNTTNITKQEGLMGVSKDKLTKAPDVEDVALEEPKEAQDEIKRDDEKSPQLTPVDSLMSAGKTILQSYGLMGPDKEKKEDTAEGKETDLEPVLLALEPIREILGGIHEGVTGMRREFPEAIASIPGGGGEMPKQVKNTSSGTIGGKNPIGNWRENNRSV